MPESTIVLAKSSKRLESAIKKKAYSFLEKLAEEDSAPGLHIEPIVNSSDPRVRTGRVDQGYRAVLFKLTDGGANTYVLHGIWPHDEAIRIAERVELRVNPVNGITEIRTVEAEAPPGRPTQQPIPPPAVPNARSQLREPAVERTAAQAWVFPVPIEQLVTQLGISQIVAERARAVTSEDRLLDLAAELDDWQGGILLDLATGMSVDEARRDLDIEIDIVSGSGSDEDILRGLRHPAAKIQFAEIEGREELRQIIESGDFGAWRVFLHPQQRSLAVKTFHGAARVTGGAGTGKTVVLLHRARHLLRAVPTARVVMTTFTTNLAHSLAKDLDQLDGGIPTAGSLGAAGAYVVGVDSLASAVIKRAGAGIAQDVQAVLGQSRLDVLKRTASDTEWNDAISTSGAGLREGLRSVAFFEAEYELVVLPSRITTRDEYLVARRPGRGVRLNRLQRMAVWDVVRAYRSNARMAGSIDFGEAAAIAAHHLDRNALARRVVDHVLVDEGQDLSPAHWQLLRTLVEEGPDDIFIAEDGHQRIYGHRLVLSRYGIRTAGRSRRLTLNYRTTAETLSYAVSLLSGSEYHDLEDDVDATDHYRSARRGPTPRRLAFPDPGTELKFVAETVAGWLAEEGTVPETIAILVRDRFQRERIVTSLNELGIDVRAVDREAVHPGEPVVMTMHRAKGTEFTKVILFGLGATTTGTRRAHETSATDLEEAMARERSLLYVAASRARDELAVTWSGEPSNFSEQ
jgi:superfamily I DNA/RNA helicase